MNRNLVYCLAILFITGSFFSCSKERSSETGAFTKAKGSLQDNSGNCLPSTVVGNYYTGVTLKESSYLEIQVNVTGIGNYTIASDTVNGFSFKSTGVFSTTGVQLVKVPALGIPLLNQNTNFLISFDGSICTFTVLVKDSTGSSGGGTGNLSDSAWQFKEGTKSFHGPIMDAYTSDTIESGIPVKIVYIQGLTAATGDSLFFIGMAFPGGVITPGNYSTATTAAFQFLDVKDSIYSATPLIPGVTTTIQVLAYNSSTKTITGTFSGTAKKTGSNTPVNISSGKFTAKLN